ncbi:Putative 4,5-dihydroxyphthalate dehydrogenase [Planctomycetes bacterium Pan216]|uniref:4,5-dihydroxyphthalate dehydrogenase n=1 Tax=Kolteria novifilia TaxID=2527975 RepID=A0A518B3J6_9BACT|nr:Putative 4,5-dihydroxyphthalate dehydrogenase [Planctomycetes bacterium Pan216]
MVRIGIVGIGFMGMIHYLAAKRIKGGKVVAIATRDPKKQAGDWTSIQGNFGPRGEQEDLSGIKVYDDAKKLIADDEIDLVHVCLPNHLHTDITAAALASGKNVLVEKPIALSLEDADKMLAAAQEAGKQLFVGHVLPFMPDFGLAYRTIVGGEYGKVRAMTLRRHISPPDWSAELLDPSLSGGPIVDLHIHDTHFVALACGVPEAVYSRGLVEKDSVNYVSTQYLYGDGGPQVVATSGAIAAKSRPFTHGLEVYLERATLQYEAGGPMTIFTEEEAVTPDIPAADPIDGFRDEIQTAVDAVTSGAPSPILDGAMARNALALCLAERDSVLSGKMVETG